MHAQAALAGGALTDQLSVGSLGAAQLARQATGGDVDAFEELVRRLQRRVYGFAYQHLRDRDEAFDLAQEIFVKLFRNLSRFDSGRPFEPWFWRLAANVTINYRRRRVPIPTEFAAVEGQTATDDVTGRDESNLVEALSQLDSAYRLPILLHYYADLSIEQIGQALNLSIPAVKSRMHRARAQLRNSLAEAELSEEQR